MSENEKPNEVLSEQECWERLKTQAVGRLVTRVGEVIDIVPINYVVDGRSIVFRTAAGSKLVELTINSSVLFEVDEIGEDAAWSVVVRGNARALEHSDEVLAASQLPLRPYLPTYKPTFVRIDVDEVTGRDYRYGEEAPLEDHQEG
ncbi:pyridoxamine 5'-phosphate oxidase family protein [Leucobacter massiliensis]|uniref:Pyridoxamine 5-phosphate oxidase n=1 Tax=Leucobacter massiliensis TaxID=1686285 RepID=A0A2S9QLE6_9MICO|nr:pyridoxamine 5'-phosphate oxidase family protein [Leucobacter massiliensis]PRI10416.1 pyridoxamine 5-phosphate oxidase [Leucobacter massiliensis]